MLFVELHTDPVGLPNPFCHLGGTLGGMLAFRGATRPHGRGTARAARVKRLSRTPCTGAAPEPAACTVPDIP